MFVLRINTDNAAFEDQGAQHELARILRRLASVLANGSAATSTATPLAHTRSISRRSEPWQTQRSRFCQSALRPTSPPWLTQSQVLVSLVRGLREYAQAHADRYEAPIGDDYLLGDHWRDAMLAVIGLLNGETPPERIEP